MAKAKEVFFFLFSRPVAENAQWRSRRSGGSVSMATSQLGNHYKLKSEGDIKGLNDKERKGGQGEMGSEDKEERRRSFPFYLK